MDTRIRIPKKYKVAVTTYFSGEYYNHTGTKKEKYISILLIIVFFYNEIAYVSHYILAQDNSK